MRKNNISGAWTSFKKKTNQIFCVNFFLQLFLQKSQNLHTMSVCQSKPYFVIKCIFFNLLYNTNWRHWKRSFQVILPCIAIRFKKYFSSLYESKNCDFVLEHLLKKFSESKLNFICLFLLDVNECKTGKHSCEQLCENTLGGYVCKCKSGYRLSHDKKSCICKLFFPFFY